MRFEDSKYFSDLKPHKIEMPYGNFYLCDTFFVSELNEGVHFDWDKVDDMMSKIIGFYGPDRKLGYISNRIHSYSSDPYSWIKVDKKYRVIIASAIVFYNAFTYKSASLEKMFSKKSIKRCFNLDEAVLWMTTLKEFT